MKKSYCIISRLSLLAAVVILLSSPARAQYLRTSYFVEGSQYRLQLNPALAPSNGFVHLPAIGHVDASLWSNSIGFDDVIDIIENSHDADYFASDRFVNNLKDENHALINAGTDLLSVGWWHGSKNFWSITWNVKVNGDMNVRRGLFSFMRDMHGMDRHDYSDYVRDLGQQELNVNAYSEIGVGYARRFGDRLSAGIRVKGLLGLGNTNFKVNRAVVKINLQGVNPDIDWAAAGPDDVKNVYGTASIEVDAQLESSFKGLEFENSQQGYIDELDFDSKHMGISGAGAGVDLGVSASVVDGLTLSAALVDLGFIKWSKGSTTIADSNTSDLRFDSENPEDLYRFAEIVTDGKTLNPDMMRLYINDNASVSRTTSLSPTMVLGADYAFAGDKLSVGVLFTNYFGSISNNSELTTSLNYKPSSQVGLTLSYSPVLSSGKSFGLALKLGPLFVGTDYMFLGKNTKCCNAMFGLSIPLSSRR